MREKRNVAYYARIIAREEKLPVWVVHIVLMFAMRNMIRMIKNSEEVTITGFGRIYYHKRTNVTTKNNNTGTDGGHIPTGNEPEPTEWIDS